jgi:polyphosphate kinase 2 (PPK2 family)
MSADFARYRVEPGEPIDLSDHDPGDTKERRSWDEYQRAYEDALHLTAPWYLAPADHRWYRNLVVARIVAGTLEQMDPRYPEPDEEADAAAREAIDSATSTT